MTTLIVVPLEAEFAALTAALAQLHGDPAQHDLNARAASVLEELRRGERRSSPRPLTAALAGGSIVVATGGLGKTQFGIQTLHHIHSVGSVSVVVCAGTSGGLASNLSSGDVVVATETVEHDFNNKNGMINLDLPRFPGSPALLDKLPAALERKSWRFAVHYGGVASGDEGIDSRARADELRASTDAIAVAWEGAGGARAARFANLPFLEIRGISDAAGPGAMDEFLRNIPATMASVASVVNELPALLD